MDELLKHFIKQSNDQFSDIKDELQNIHDKLDTLAEFKVRTMTNAWWVSIITSGVCGLVTMVVTAYFSYKK